VAATISAPAVEPTNTRPAPRGQGTARALWRLAPLTLTAFMQMSWVEQFVLSDDPRASIERDWHQFFETGQQLVAGNLSAIYPHVFERGYLWLYPPYCIYLTAPLGLLPEWWAYALCALVEVLAVAAALVLLRAAVPAPGEDHTTAAIVALASMPFNTTVAIGQISGVLTLLVAASLWAWHRRRPVTAGVLLALLFIKPNLAVFFPPLCLLARQWRVLAGMAAGCTLLLLGSLPLGVARWHEYLVTLHGYAGVLRGGVPVWKQLTLYAFWRSVSGSPDSLTPALGVAWVASVALVVTATAVAWWRLGDSEAALPRLFGLAVLLAVSANLYVYFYDGLLLLVPGIVWHVRRADYASRGRHRLIGICIFLVFVVGYARIFLAPYGVSWAGMLIAIWLLCEAADLLARPAPAALAS